MAFLKNIFFSSIHFINNNSPTVIKKYFAPLLSGIFLGISFVPFPLFTTFFAFVPLWFFLTQQTKIKEIIIGSWITSFVATLIGFNWIIYTAHNFGQLNWFLSFIALIGFSALANLFIVVASLLWFLLTKNQRISPLLKLSLLPILFSLFHTIIPTLFPWNMGYMWLWGGMPAAQTAEIWGFRFLNTLFYIFNLLALILYKHRWDFIGKWIAAASLSLFLSLNILGTVLEKRLPQTDASVNALVVQHNIGTTQNQNYTSAFKSAEEKSLYKIKNITIKSIFRNKKKKKIDFIVWPEGGYPYVIKKRRKTVKSLSRIIRKLNLPLITGGITKNHSKYSNSLVVLDRNGRIMKPIYDKVKLVAFGEYLPGSKTFPFIRKLAPYFGANLTPGKKPQVKLLEGVQLGLQICYESLFDNLSRQLALNGAQVLINATNDSWYGSWQQPWQHLTMTLGRAIEIRRPLIRSTNTGISTVIYSNGQIQERSPINKPWAFIYTIPYYQQPIKTLFMSWGFYINEIFLFLFALFSFAFNFLKKRN